MENKHNSTKHIIRKLIIIFFILFFVILLSIKAYSIAFPTYNLYVSADGSDNNAGTINHPVKTIEKCVQVINNKIKFDNYKGTIIVNIKSGTYNITNGLSIENYNIEKNKVIFRGNNTVFFNGGIYLNCDNFINSTSKEASKYSKNISPSSKMYIYDLSKYNLNYNIKTESITNAPELFFNETPMTLARYPSKGFLLTGNILKGKNKENSAEGYSFNFNDTEVKKWSDTSNIFMKGYWCYDWYDSTVKAASIDKTNNAISFNDKIPYGINENQKFYFLNVPDELHNPGDYYIDYNQKLLFFIPPASLKNSTLYLSDLNKPLASIKNSKNVIFENIVFEGCRNYGISIKNSSDISIKNCSIRNLTESGIITNSSKNIIISDCTICNTGKCGVEFNDGNRASLQSSNDKLENSIIYNFGRIKRSYCGAANITGVGVTISHNKIYNAPHLGILFNGNDNIIENNEINNVCTETSDAGAIYSGRDWTYRGNIIRNNIIHDAGNNSKNFVVGIYLDDCMSSAEIYNNTIYRVNIAMLIGGGRDNIIKSNTISDCRESIVFDERGLTSNLDELYKRLNSVPYKSDLWIKKYPSIKSLSKDTNLGIPKGNIIENNKLIRTSNMTLAKSVIKNGTVKNNLYTK